MSLEIEGFNALVEEIIAQGHDEKTACRYAVLIGDTPARDQDNNIIVLGGKDGKEVIAVLKPLKFFEE